MIGGIVAAGVLSGHPTRSSSARPPASPGVVDAVTGVPAATVNSVGKGTIVAAPKAVHDAPLTSGGKPQVLFVGAEYCPYCVSVPCPTWQERTVYL